MVIRAKAVQAIPMGELGALSNRYEGNSKFWEAAQLSNTVLRSCTLRKEKKLDLVRQILSNLDQISDKQPEHFSLEATIAVQFIFFAGLGTPEFSDFMARSVANVAPFALTNFLLLLTLLDAGSRNFVSWAWRWTRGRS
jgi:hypothetical protein